MTDAGTKFNYVWYDPSVANTRRRVLVPTATLTGNNVLQAASANYDCVSTFVTGSAFNLYSINSTGAGAFTLVDNAFAQISNSDVPDIGAASDKVVGPECWAFRLGKFIYVKNAATTAGPKYTKSNNGSTLAGTSGIRFDPTLKFALNGNQLFRYGPKSDGTSDWISQFTATGLKATK